VQFTYRHWDHHLIQWLPEHPTYEAVEALIDERNDTPLVHFFLTEREARGGTKPQHHYVNNAELREHLSISVSERRVAHVAIDLSQTQTDGAARFDLRLPTSDGAAAWRFTAAGAPSRQYGAGLIDNAEAAHDLAGGFLVFFLEAASLSNADTELSLGGTSFSVREWSELSQPPHFTAYRAVHSTGVHLGYFYTASEIRITRGAAQELQSGASWSTRWQVGSDGEPKQASITVSEVHGDHVSFLSDQYQIATRAAEHGLAIESLTAPDASASMALIFSPPVPDLGRMPDGSHKGAFSIDLGSQRDVITGTIDISKADSEVSVSFDPQTPAWTAPLQLITRIAISDDEVRYTSRTVFPGSDP
jgi:hypothetical protein